MKEHQIVTKLWIARYKVNDKNRNKNISWKPCKLKGKLKATLLQLLFDAKALNKKIKDGRIFKALLWYSGTTSLLISC